MNQGTKNIMRLCGFEKAIEKVEGGICPLCDKKINLDEFRDDISRKEFDISGMCAACQQEVFKD
jgi:hypothetical protein